MVRRTEARKKLRRDALAALNEAASDLYEAGGIDKVTMRKFDLLCRTPVEELGSREILALREKAGVSQGVFASVLNVRPGLISQWERGELPETYPWGV